MKRLSTFTLIIFAVGGAFQLCVAQSAPSSIASYFRSLSSPQHTESQADVDEFMALVATVPQMQPSALSGELRTLDGIFANHSPLVTSQPRRYAALFLFAVGQRPDGADLISRFTDSLVVNLNGNDIAVRRVSVLALSEIGHKHVDLVMPGLVSALSSDDSPATIGPAVAATLLEISPNGETAAQAVAKYMRRTELTTEQLKDIIHVIGSPSERPMAVETELIRYLDNKDESVRIEALISLSKSNGSVLPAAAKERINQMLADPQEAPRVKKIAQQSLVGPVTENPNTAN